MQLYVDALRPRVIRSFAAVRRFVRDDSGQDLLEYALLVAFVGVAGWAALSAIGPTVSTTYASWVSPTTGAPSLWEPAEPWNSAGS